eukprot:SAG22_NODE_4753_length_1174_cov_1.681860_1_plen_101_part_10
MRSCSTRQQLIFENNTCDGASLTSEGSNLDTYGCPMQQHAYMHANKVTNTWGYDREVMTFDGDDRHGEATVLSLKGGDHCLSLCFSAFPCGSTALTADRCN